MYLQFVMGLIVFVIFNFNWPFHLFSHTDKNLDHEFYAYECAWDDNMFRAWCDVVYLKSIHKKQDEVNLKSIHKRDKQCRCKNTI
jgi:hypothetical protein